MDCTVFVDASFCPNTGASGWGVGIMSKHLQSAYLRGGYFTKFKPTNVVQAELFALVNGISVANSLDIYKEKAMVQSDCMAILALLPLGDFNCRESAAKNGMKVHPKYYQDSIPEYAKLPLLLLKSMVEDKELIYRHVKAHVRINSFKKRRSGGHGRFWVNTECDRIAKIYMRKERKTLLDQGLETAIGG